MDLAPYIEHTNLSPVLTIRQVDQLVEEAVEHRFAGICVPPFWVERARREIAGRNVLLVTVAGFPLGYSRTETKLLEIELALKNGADEVDVVWNISAFKTGLPWTKIELAKCSKVVHDHHKVLKVIIETAFLSDDEIRQACKLCADAGADYVKTSTGFAAAGARKEHVALIRASLPDSVLVKASGGIKTAGQARELVEAGASRIGTSSGVAICSNDQTKP